MGSIGAEMGNRYSSQFPAIKLGLSQKVSVGAASTQSTSVGPKTSIVRLFSTVDCFVAIGENPTAVADTTAFLPAGVIEYFAVRVGHNYKVAAIRLGGTSGDLYVTEGAHT